MKDSARVIVTILGGVADVTEIPEGITVEVRDYDIEGFEGEFETDEYGKQYEDTIYTRWKGA